MRFTLALHTDDGVKYGVTVPDLPGAYSAGDTFDEALELAREAIDAHCELLAERGEEIPEPAAPHAHLGDKEYKGAIWVVIDVDVSQYEGRAEKINITLPSRDLRRIDEAARALGTSRSAFLKDAARAVIAGRFVGSDGSPFPVHAKTLSPRQRERVGRTGQFIEPARGRSPAQRRKPAKI